MSSPATSLPARVPAGAAPGLQDLLGAARAASRVLATATTAAKDDALLAYRSFSAVRDRIDRAYDASRAYLDEALDD